MGFARRVSGHTTVLYSEAPVVGHTQWVSKAISEAKAAGGGLVLLTPDTTKLTRPMAHLCDVLGVMWVVDDGRGALYVGTTGQRVHERDGHYFAEDALHEQYSRQGSAQDIGGVRVQAETLMPRRTNIRVGGLAEAVCRALSGAQPLGWGVQEPVTQRWSVPDISSRYGRANADGHFLHFVGPRPEGERGQVNGSLEIQKPRDGIVEHIEASVALPAPWSDDERLDFARSLHAMQVRWARVYHVVGTNPALVPPLFLGLPVPSVLIFGAEALAGRDAHEYGELALMHGALRYEVMRGGSAPSLTVLLRDEPREGVPAPAVIMEAMYRALMPEVG
ncbi:DUF6177 family protein [Dermacoccus barathri]|uniref:DUF6177 family protein n=1 Tax=Dermacoccus barathri TaxID=322601 RepID=UPI001D0D7E8E|nr:DUF6177 family protein [Dermacoccus barathri]